MYLRAGDTISGQEGKATAIIDGNVEDMFYVKTLEAIFTKNKEEVRTLGRRGAQHKSIGWSGTGSLSLFYITTVFREAVLKFAKTGVDTNFTITVANNDPGSSIGLQTVALYNCNLDSTVLAKLDVDADSLDEEIAFTFDDFDILDSFGSPIV